MERSVYKASFVELNRQRMGDGVDDLGQYLVRPAVGDDDLGALADEVAGLVDETGKIDDFYFDAERVLG